MLNIAQQPVGPVRGGGTEQSVPAMPVSNRADSFSEDEEDYDPCLDLDWCDKCQGSGKVTTADYESYFGANYKPCPKCGGDPCIGEPPTS